MEELKSSQVVMELISKELPESHRNLTELAAIGLIPSSTAGKTIIT